MSVLTKQAAKKTIRGTAAMPSKYRQPTVGIMNIDIKTMKHVPTAQNNCHIQPNTPSHTTIVLQP